MQKYILCFVIDDDKNFIGLTKKRGYEFLVGKHTFPGGKVEEFESLESASSRELFEETGVSVDTKSWIHVSVVNGQDFQLHILAAKSNNVKSAYSKEDEPVWVGNIYHHMDRANNREFKHEYVPDFCDVANIALEGLESK